MIAVRRARASDVRGIRDLVRPYADSRRLVDKAPVAYFEGLQQFRVALDGDPADEVDRAGRVVGCGALHVLWEDLAEVRTLAVDPAYRRHGIGGRVLDALLGDARQLGVERVFCLTFEVDFFARHGFVEIKGVPLQPDVYAELLRSYDEGVAEFLDLEDVKPNTLGNTRMLCAL